MQTRGSNNIVIFWQERKLMANKLRGSSFDDFLKEEGIFEECDAEAVKHMLNFQAEQELKKKKTKSQ
jgi:hypothetical protein